MSSKRRQILLQQKENERSFSCGTFWSEKGTALVLGKSIQRLRPQYAQELCFRVNHLWGTKKRTYGPSVDHTECSWSILRMNKQTKESNVLAYSNTRTCLLPCLSLPTLLPLRGVWLLRRVRLGLYGRTCCMGEIRRRVSIRTKPGMRLLLQV
jgi:hypothetical protein